MLFSKFHTYKNANLGKSPRRNNRRETGRQAIGGGTALHFILPHALVILWMMFTMHIRAIHYPIAVLCAFVALSCGKQEPRRALLEHFFRDYVTHADAKTALQWCAGAAEQKLNAEIASLAGQPRPETFPHVSYRIFTTHTQADTTLYDLLLTIENDNAQSFTRELLITEAPTPAGVKVVDFDFVK